MKIRGHKKSGDRIPITNQGTGYLLNLKRYNTTTYTKLFVPYFPVIAIASVAIIVQEIYRRYKAGEISYSKFKLLVGIAVSKRVSR